jgi:PIN domain nuclease of toxin-antitoxin system
LIVLDTHAFIWLVADPERLTFPAREALAADPKLAISTASVQEIAYLATRGRLSLDRPVADWIAAALGVHEIRALATTVAVALRAGSLDPERFHGDPVDRLIYATAVENDAQLVTADERLQRSDPERAVW